MPLLQTDDDDNDLDQRVVVVKEVIHQVFAEKMSRKSRELIWMMTAIAQKKYLIHFRVFIFAQMEDSFQVSVLLELMSTLFSNKTHFILNVTDFSKEVIAGFKSRSI